MAVAAAVPLTSAQNWYLVAITAGSLFLCLVFTASRASSAGVLGHKGGSTAAGTTSAPRLTGRMGQGQWDFSTSFATNIAVIGSVLTLIINSGIFQTATTAILPSDTYSGLGILFGSVALVAPLLYNGTARKVDVDPSHRDTAAEYHGTVWGFLLAAVATQWALLGSIVTVFLTLLELVNDNSLSATPVILMAITLAAAVVFFARYSWVKMGGTVADQYDPGQPPPPMTPAQPRDERAAPADQVQTLPAPRYPAPWTFL